jgi:hypothetical protein
MLSMECVQVRQKSMWHVGKSPRKQILWEAQVAEDVSEVFLEEAAWRVEWKGWVAQLEEN